MKIINIYRLIYIFNIPSVYRIYSHFLFGPYIKFVLILFMEIFTLSLSFNYYLFTSIVVILYSQTTTLSKSGPHNTLYCPYLIYFIYLFFRYCAKGNGYKFCGRKEFYLKMHLNCTGQIVQINICLTM